MMKVANSVKVFVPRLIGLPANLTRDPGVDIGAFS
jgi:hypothetical protein